MADQSSRSQRPTRRAVATGSAPPAASGPCTEDGHGPANATDGDPGARRSSSFVDDQRIRVGLGSVRSVDRVDPVWEQAYPKTYVVQVSEEGEQCTHAASMDDTTVPLPFDSGDAGRQVTDFEACTARHVRLPCGIRDSSRADSPWSPGAVDSAMPGTDPPPHPRATAYGEEDGHPAARVTDRNSGTHRSPAREDHQRIQVGLGSTRRLDRVAVLWERACAKTYVVQVSDDGFTWTDVRTVGDTPDPLNVSVNGVRVPVRGGDRGRDEPPLRMPAERVDAPGRTHRATDRAMIRDGVDGSDREEFHAVRDAHDASVGNDVTNAWSTDPPDREAFVPVARDTEPRHRALPCVAAWCGAAEGDPPATIDQGVRAAVESRTPGDLHQGNSAQGVITGGPCAWVGPRRHCAPWAYGREGFGFRTETGRPAVSTAASTRAMAVGDDRPEWPIGGAWYCHDRDERGTQAPGSYRAAIESRLGTAAAIDTRLGTARDLDDLTRETPFVDHEDGTAWLTYDHDFDVTGAHFGRPRVHESLHVRADPVKWQIIAVNHTRRALTHATVTAETYDLSGRRIASTRRARVDVAPAGSAVAFTAAPSDDLPDLHLLRLTLTDDRGRVLSRDTYWRCRTPEALRALDQVSRTRLSASLSPVSRDGDRREMSATVRNTGSMVAAMVRLSLLDAEDGARVLPALYDDNHLWLLPGETRSITLCWSATALPSGRPKLRVEGYNTHPVTVRG
ncbi:discoidin domain-containing protein [Streptomyces flaveolus]|uniref:Discoidin domain-containing protein n=1 Tax=Streptomyces flaveolus TaxID=67297 RepID=A0ABV3ANU1_9ACTN